MMRITRFVLPFLFVRNWHDGSWELSRARMILFTAFLILMFFGLIIAYTLQSPIVYTSSL
jgi:hypothetical protein